MSASGREFQDIELPVLAACGRIGLPIADIQLENPRGIGKGRLLTRNCHSRPTALGKATYPHEASRPAATPEDSSSEGTPYSEGRPQVSLGADRP